MAKQWRWERRQDKKDAVRKRMPKHGRTILTLVRLQVEKAQDEKK